MLVHHIPASLNPAAAIRKFLFPKLSHALLDVRAPLSPCGPFSSLPLPVLSTTGRRRAGRVVWRVGRHAPCRGPTVRGAEREQAGSSHLPRGTSLGRGLTVSALLSLLCLASQAAVVSGEKLEKLDEETWPAARRKGLLAPRRKLESRAKRGVGVFFVFAKTWARNESSSPKFGGKRLGLGVNRG